MDPAGVLSERYRAFIVAAGIATFAIVLALVVLSAEPPGPASSDAPPDVFSARRAAYLVRDLAGDAVPAPIGSDAHTVRRDRAMALLRNAGLAPEIHATFTCTPNGRCAWVQNILAEVPQRTAPRSERAVLLTAHYDSVPAAAGASDDSASVAAIAEIAGILRRESGRNRVLVLLSDGEEFGLLGAHAFATSHPEAVLVGSVVNLEARGTEGASYLFETSPGNAWLVSLMRGMPRPATSSLYYTIYDRLPNDTDFSIYKRKGLAGVNFAFIAGVPRYHTPVDNLAYLSLESLQHHGENALAMTRALRDADLAAPRGGNAIFFDVFGRAIVSWPESLALPLLIAAILLGAGAITVHFRRGTLMPLSFGFGALCALAAVVLSVLLGWCSLRLMDLFEATGSGWMAYPGAARLAFATGGIASVLLAGIIVARYAGPVACWAATLTVYLLLSALLTLFAPGTSYLTIPTTFVLAAFGFFFAADRPRIETLMIVASMTLSGITMLPPVWSLYVAMGAGTLIAMSAVISVIAMPMLMPLSAATRRTTKAFAWIVAAISLVLLGIACSLDPYSEAVPRHQNLLAHGTGDGALRILAPGSPEPVLPQLRAAMTPLEQAPFPWMSPRGWWAEERTGRAPAPPELLLRASGVEDGRRNLRLVFRSRRGAPRGSLIFDDAGRIDALSVNGVSIDAAAARFKAGGKTWSRITIGTLREREFVVELFLRDVAPFTVFAEDRTFVLPREAADLQQIRDHYAVPVHEGDVTIATERYEF